MPAVTAMRSEPRHGLAPATGAPVAGTGGALVGRARSSGRWPRPGCALRLAGRHRHCHDVPAGHVVDGVVVLDDVTLEQPLLTGGEGHVDLVPDELERLGMLVRVGVAVGVGDIRSLRDAPQPAAHLQSTPSAAWTSAFARAPMVPSTRDSCPRSGRQARGSRDLHRLARAEGGRAQGGSRCVPPRCFLRPCPSAWTMPAPWSPAPPAPANPAPAPRGFTSVSERISSDPVAAGTRWHGPCRTAHRPNVKDALATGRVRGPTGRLRTAGTGEPAHAGGPAEDEPPHHDSVRRVGERSVHTKVQAGKSERTKVSPQTVWLTSPSLPRIKARTTLFATCIPLDPLCQATHPHSTPVTK